MYFIYGIFNKLNGKLYIGITNNIKRRWYEHKKNSKKITNQSYAIHHAMAKYGFENFIYKPIEQVADLTLANLQEIAWIKFLKENGYQLYNETDGGDGVRGHSHPWTKEQKEKMSKLNSGSGNPMYGVQLFGEANGNYGKEMKSHVKEELLKHRRKLTDEQIEEIKKLYTTNKYTQTQLSKQFGVSLTQIHRIIKGKSWGDKEHDAVLTKKNLTNNEVTDLIKLYIYQNYTIKELSNHFKCTTSHICKILLGKRWAHIMYEMIIDNTSYDYYHAAICDYNVPSKLKEVVLLNCNLQPDQKYVGKELILRDRNGNIKLCGKILTEGLKIKSDELRLTIQT